MSVSLRNRDNENYVVRYKDGRISNSMTSKMMKFHEKETEKYYAHHLKSEFFYIKITLKSLFKYSV